MADNVDNLVLEHLRYLRKGQDALTEDVKMLILRMGSVERSLSAHGVAEVQQNSEIDRLRIRVDRIERRLELNDSS